MCKQQFHCIFYMYKMYTFYKQFKKMTLMWTRPFTCKKTAAKWQISIIILEKKEVQIEFKKK